MRYTALGMSSSTPLLLHPARALRLYHRHRVVGLENIPKKGGALIVVNHSFATYDSFLLGAAIYEKHHRLVHALGHSWLFRIPGVRELMTDAGAVPAGMDAALGLLKRRELLGLAPGGMREALRSSEERYRVRWGDRKGFVRLAIQAGCPIVLAACPRADEIFDVSAGLLTEIAYAKFKLPVAYVRGWGPLPRAVPLTHYVAKPLTPPPAPNSPKRLEALVDEWHSELTAAMDELLERRD